MIKTYLGATAAVLGLAGASLLPATMALASSENAATVTKDKGCMGFVPSSDGGMGPMIETTKGHHRVDTRSGVTVLSCQFDIPDSLTPASVTKATGFDCGAGGQVTTDSTMLATPGGRALLVCKINGG